MKQLKHSYSDELYHKRILIIGLMPPPLGGISVHIERVQQKLRRQKNIVRHFKSEPRYRYRLIWLYLVHLAWVVWRFRPDNIHLHSLFLPNGLQELRCLVWLKKIVSFDITIVIHNGRWPYERSAQWKQKFRSIMPAFHHVVFMGKLSAEAFAANGIMPLCRTTIEAAFLPPDEQKESAILATYPKNLFAFLSRHKKTALCNGSALRFYQGKDLYGFDQCIDAFASVAQTDHDLGLILVLSKVEQDAYLKTLQKRIADYGLPDRVYWLIGQHELWPLMKKIDIFVRPTLSDGESVSIQEALYFKTYVIASDASERPYKTYLYRTGDSADLARVLNVCLHDLQHATSGDYTTMLSENR